jgi:ATP-dependent DNA helicase RecG
MTGRPEREQVWDYPLEALREAVINAVCHRDYTISSNVEIRIYDDRLVVRSPGGLPLGITLEDLYKPHSSELRNKGIAEIFYDMELIEQWGSGIDKMREGGLTAGLHEPVFEEHQGFRVIFRKYIYTEEYLRSLGLNERQLAALMYVKERGGINISAFKALIPQVAEKTLYRDLRDLVNKKVLKQVGEKKGRKYELK